MKLCERGEKLIASCIERQAMGHLRGLLADVKREAAAFCATIESPGPYFTVEDVERTMARKLQPVISALQETLEHLDRASRSVRSGRPGLTLLPFSDDRKTARTRRSSQFLRTSL